MHKPTGYVARQNHHRATPPRRFMESADVNVAFREMFGALRFNIRRGQSNAGQLYAIEMDARVPGELFGTEWIPPAIRGIADAAVLADPARRRALYDRLLAEPRPQALFAYVIEHTLDAGCPALGLEIVSATCAWRADYVIVPGEGWHRRELLTAAHRRIDPLVLA
jgi:hypothetical protein